MKHLVLLFLLLVGSPVFSQVIFVKSGEHGSFTRLVLQFPQSPDWRFGRTVSGYELEISGTQPRYDLSEVYRPIGKERIRSIWADPKTGRLQLGIGCKCHALVDASQDRLIVIDIHDGEPLTDLAFEATLGGDRLPPLGPAKTPRPRARPQNENTAPPYNWLQAEAEPKPEAETKELELRLPIAEDLQKFRADLITQLDRASSDGVVRLTPDPILSIAEPRTADGGIEQNFGIGTGAPLTRSGTICPDPAELDVSLWAVGEDAFAELSDSREKILGEFDRVDPSALAKAIKVAIYYGFGVEARSLMIAFGASVPSSENLMALSYLVDGEIPDNNPFKDQQACPGPVALWALAAAPKGSSVPDLDADAAIRTFMALPSALQAVLSLDIAGKLQASGYDAQAEVLLNTLQRSGPVTEAIMPLAAAQLSIERGKIDEAAALLQEKPEGEERQSAALLLEAETNFRRGIAPDPEFLTELEALHFVEGSGPDGPEIKRGLALTRALQGDYTGAFAMAAEDEATSRDLWGLLASNGSDADLLYQSSGEIPDSRRISRADRSAIASRLIELGLPMLARNWLNSDEDDAELRARLDLLERNGRSAIRALASVQSPDAEKLRIAAFESIGSFDRAAELAERAGNPEDAARLRRWGGEFPAPAGEGSDPWSGLTATLSPTENGDREPSLAAARTVLEDTRKTVGLVDALLQQTRMK